MATCAVFGRESGRSPDPQGAYSPLQALGPVVRLLPPLDEGFELLLLRPSLTPEAPGDIPRERKPFLVSQNFEETEERK